MLNNGGIGVLGRRNICLWYLFNSVTKKQCWMWSESFQYRAISIMSVGLDAVEVFCSAYIHAKYFFFFFFFSLQQRKLVPSQISLVTMATASQPGGNVMVKKNVLMGQMNQKQHAVSSTEKWFLRHVVLWKRREIGGVVPNTCRMMCQVLLLLEQKLKTQKIQVIQIRWFPNF